MVSMTLTQWELFVTISRLGTGEDPGRIPEFSCPTTGIGRFSFLDLLGKAGRVLAIGCFLGAELRGGNILAVSSLQIPGLLKCHTEIEVRLGEVGIQRQGPAVLGNRAVP